MFQTLSSLIGFFSLLSHPSSTVACSPKAVALPFTNVLLGNKARARGISFNIGSSNAQPMSLLPRPRLNDTYVYDPQVSCVDSIARCTTYRGGLYDRDQSNSALIGQETPHAGDNIRANWTKDTINLSGHLSLENYEFGTSESTKLPWIAQGDLGLGLNSTFLADLQQANITSSRSYSFFWGPETTLDSEDGSLTIGGYDDNLSDSFSRTTQPLHIVDDCRTGMSVDITNIVIQGDDGVTSEILAGSSKIRACIALQHRTVFQIPRQNRDSVISGMGGTQLNESGATYTSYYRSTLVTPSSATFKGNLSVTINNELTVSFTHEQLLFGEPYIDRTGIVQHNQSRPSIPITALKDDDDGVQSKLGGLFFTSAYLMVDHDANNFTISRVQRNATTPKLIGIDSASNCQGLVDIMTGSDSVRLTPGAIAGIVVGSIFGVVLLAGATFLYWKRRHGREVGKPNTYLLSELDHNDLERKCGHAPHITEAPGAVEILEIAASRGTHVAELDSHQLLCQLAEPEADVASSRTSGQS